MHTHTHTHTHTHIHILTITYTSYIYIYTYIYKYTNTILYIYIHWYSLIPASRLAYVSTRQHTSAYVSIRLIPASRLVSNQEAPFRAAIWWTYCAPPPASCPPSLAHAPGLGSANIRKHTSAYVSIRHIWSVLPSSSCSCPRPWICQHRQHTSFI